MFLFVSLVFHNDMLLVKYVLTFIENYIIFFSLVFSHYRYNGNTVAASISRRVVCRGCKNGGKGKNKKRCAQCGRCPNEVKTVLRQMAPGFNVQQQEEVPSKHRCKEEKTTLNAYVFYFYSCCDDHFSLHSFYCGFTCSLYCADSY